MRTLAAIVHSALFDARDWQLSLLEAYKHIPKDPEVKAIKSRLAEYERALAYYNSTVNKQVNNGTKVKQVRGGKLGG